MLPEEPSMHIIGATAYRLPNALYVALDILSLNKYILHIEYCLN